MNYSEDSSMILASLSYIIVSLCFVYPSNEFVQAGFTIQNIFSNFLGSEHLNFTFYHIKRTAVTSLVHAFLPLGEYKAHNL